MSDPRDDRHGSSGRYRRTPEINAHGGSFVAGQGGRTVLPSLTAAFPTFPTSSHYQGHPYPGMPLLVLTFDARSTPRQHQDLSTMHMRIPLEFLQAEATLFPLLMDHTTGRMAIVSIQSTKPT